jgi:hypothetical protein
MRVKTIQSDARANREVARAARYIRPLQLFHLCAG